jgi:hypothetical protein
MAGCARGDYPDPMFGWMLEHNDFDGVPAEQVTAREDGQTAREELEPAAAADLSCFKETDGVVAVDP